MSHKAGLNIDTMVLTYRVTLPGTNTLRPLSHPANQTAVVGSTINQRHCRRFTRRRYNGSRTAPAYWRNRRHARALRTYADAGRYGAAANSIGSVSSNRDTHRHWRHYGARHPSQPASVNAAVGGTATLTVAASGSPTFQWRKNGTAITGANSASLTFGTLVATDTASYDVVLTNSLGTVTSSSATLIISTPLASRLSNLSVRTTLAAGQILIVGFTMQGGAKAPPRSRRRPGSAPSACPHRWPTPFALFRTIFHPDRRQ